MPIYVFPGPDNTCSIVCDATILTAEQKQQGIELAALPETDRQEGKKAVLRGDLATGQVWYEYVDAPADPLEQRVVNLEEGLAMLHMEVNRT